MADAKSKTTGGDNGGSLVPIIIGILVLALFVFFGSDALFDVKFFNIEGIFQKIANGGSPVIRTIFSKNTWNIIGTISALFSLFFLTIIVFSLVRLREMQINDKVDIERRINLARSRMERDGDKSNSRWVNILNLTASENESDWRLAVIEADAMLDDILKEKGYYGINLADRLKSAREGGVFFTVNNAFEAHNVRNRIAHEGINFSLSQMETRRVMRLYESVFEEFKII